MFDLGAFTKDAFETHLKSLVCAGRLTLAKARVEIAHNWVAYWTLPSRLGPSHTMNGSCSRNGNWRWESSKLQRDLKAVADATRMWDQDAFAYQMHGLVRELILGVAASRLEPLIRGLAPLGKVE